jgi:hypothetical protein
MDHSLSFLIAAWIWTVLSAATVCGLVIGAVLSFRDFEAYAVAILLLGASAATGLLFASLSFLGVPVAAIWAWRILAGVACAYGLLGVAKALREDSDVGEVLSIVGATVLAGAVLTTGILTASRPFTPPPVTAASPHIAGTLASQIDVWHTFALAMLALTTMTFLLLFLLAMRRGIPPAVESHWGGLGGGITGWEISKSLSYLIGVIVCAVLFSLFLLREEITAVSRVPVTPAKEGAGPPSPKPEPKSGTDTGAGVSARPQATPGVGTVAK